MSATPPRDPSTGQFVSRSESGSGPYHEGDRLWANVFYNVPAADHGGGAEQFFWDDPGAPLVDFSDDLGSDEVFEVYRLHVRAILGLPTTATAEGSAGARVGIAREVEPEGWNLDPTFYNSGTGIDAESNNIDAKSFDAHEDTVLYGTLLHGESSALDTTNGVGTGADYDRDERTIDYRGMYSAGPMFDQDDELHAPLDHWTNNVSDHATNVWVSAHFEGRIWDVEDLS